jgi:drug/metabolite transporter (DMT)-like permease
MVVGAFWFSLMSVCVKLAGRRLPSMEIVLARGLITIALSYAVLVHKGVRPVLGRRRRLLVLRGVFGAAALACFVFSLTHLPLGEATLIQYTNPVFAIVIAALWFREGIGRREVAALAASLIGVLLITRPAALFGGTAAGLNPSWVGIALLGAACSGAAYATIRRMEGEHPDVVVFYLPLMQVPMALPFIASGWLMPTAWEWVLLAAMGIATQLAQVSMTRGLQQERTARATTVGYVQLIFAGAWGALLFSEPITIWTLAGGVVVVAGALYLAFSRHAAVGTDE